MKLILIALCFLVALARADDQEDVIEEFVEHIPEDDKTEFLRYALSLGYEAVEKKHLKGEKPPALFGKLYNYYLEEHLIKDDTRFHNSIICFPSAGCVDISDSAVYP